MNDQVARVCEGLHALAAIEHLRVLFDEFVLYGLHHNCDMNIFNMNRIDIYLLNIQNYTGFRWFESPELQTFGRVIIISE
jgi:hypothetical protein